MCVTNDESQIDAKHLELYLLLYCIRSDTLVRVLVLTAFFVYRKRLARKATCNREKNSKARSHRAESAAVGTNFNCSETVVRVLCHTAFFMRRNLQDRVSVANMNYFSLNRQLQTC